MSIKPHIKELASALREKGVQYAFGVAGGGTSLELITALAESGVNYYPVSHEGAAALMAGACCSDGKTRAVALSIKGPGLVNMVPGITSNYFENRPSITISEAYDPQAPTHKMHKRAPHYEMIQPILKGFVGSDGKKETISNLVAVMEKEVPGPGHIELYGGPDEAEHTFLASMERGMRKSEVSISSSAMEHIRQSKRPALVLGSIAQRAFSGFDFSSIGIPVATTAAAKGSVDEYSSLSAGIVTGEIKELSPESTVLAQADLIVGIGLRNTEVVAAKPFGAPLIIFDGEVDQALHGGFEVESVYAVRDINGSIFKTLFEELSKKEWGKDEIQKLRLQLEKELFDSDLMPATVFRVLQQNMSEDAILTLDTGLFCVIGETVWKARSTKHFIGSSVGRFMGTGIPTAIGVSISNPNNDVVCVMGDGGIRPYLSEIRLAVSERLPILFVLMSDGRYGSVALAGLSKDLHPRGFEIEDTAWHKVVGQLGCESKSISNETEFTEALNMWKKASGPLFLGLSFDKDNYLAMTSKLR